MVHIEDSTPETMIHIESNTPEEPNDEVTSQADENEKLKIGESPPSQELAKIPHDRLDRGGPGCFSI